MQKITFIQKRHRQYTAKIDAKVKGCLVGGQQIKKFDF